MASERIGKLWQRWKKPAGIAHLICCGGLLIWAAAAWSGYAVAGGAFLQPVAYAAGLLMLGGGIWLAATLAGRRLNRREGARGDSG